MSTFYDVNHALSVLSRRLIEEGEIVNSRGGECRELTGVQFTITEPVRREVLIPERRADLVAQVAETLWVLAGRNDVSWLERYLPRAPKFSDDGSTWRSAYGPRLMRQLPVAVDRLRKDPNDRRAVISLWDPEVDGTEGIDVACNNWLQFLVRDGKLHMHIATRSNDLIWGWSGINQFEWSSLQEIVAAILDVGVGPAKYFIGSLHLYARHYARAKEIFESEGWEPKFGSDSSLSQILNVADLTRQVKGAMTFEAQLPDGDVERSPAECGVTDPLILSWLEVLRTYWHRKNGGQLNYIRQERAAAAYQMRKRVPKKNDMVEDLVRLHEEKDTVYGDSWCRRGELVGIQANVARKIDRLGRAGAGDTELDTLRDLVIYLAKYLVWKNSRFSREDRETGARHQKLKQATKKCQWTQTKKSPNKNFLPLRPKDHKRGSLEDQKSLKNI